MKKIDISKIYQQQKELSQQEKIKIGGWVKNWRESKKILFAEINDGTALGILHFQKRIV